jgi:hypothetical protein
MSDAQPGANNIEEGTFGNGRAFQKTGKLGKILSLKSIVTGRVLLPRASVVGPQDSFYAAADVAQRTSGAPGVRARARPSLFTALAGPKLTA